MSQEPPGPQALLVRLWADHQSVGGSATSHRSLQSHLRDEEAAALLDGHGDLAALVHATVCEACLHFLALAADLDAPAVDVPDRGMAPAALVMEVATIRGVLSLQSCSGVHRVRPALAARRGSHEAVVSVRDHAAVGRLEVDLYADKVCGATAVVRWRDHGGPAPTTASLRGPGPGKHFTTIEYGVATLPIAGPGRWTLQLWDDHDALCATIVLGWRSSNAEPE